MLGAAIDPARAPFGRGEVGLAPSPLGEIDRLHRVKFQLNYF